MPMRKPLPYTTPGLDANWFDWIELIILYWYWLLTYILYEKGEKVIYWLNWFGCLGLSLGSGFFLCVRKFFSFHFHAFFFFFLSFFLLVLSVMPPFPMPSIQLSLRFTKVFAFFFFFFFFAFAFMCVCLCVCFTVFASFFFWSLLFHRILLILFYSKGFPFFFFFFFWRQWIKKEEKCAFKYHIILFEYHCVQRRIQVSYISYFASLLSPLMTSFISHRSHLYYRVS